MKTANMIMCAAVMVGIPVGGTICNNSVYDDPVVFRCRVV